MTFLSDHSACSLLSYQACQRQHASRDCSRGRPGCEQDRHNTDRGGVEQHSDWTVDERLLAVHRRTSVGYRVDAVRSVYRFNNNHNRADDVDSDEHHHHDQHHNVDSDDNNGYRCRV